MKSLKTAIVLFVAAIGCFAVASFIVERKYRNATGDSDALKSLIAGRGKMLKDGISDFGIWKVGPKESEVVYYLTKTSPADVELPNGGESLAVYDTDFKLLYEEKAVGFSGIEAMNILRGPTPQLIIKAINYGGSGRFLKVLDYREKKVVCLTNDDDTLYSGDVQFVPQYQDPKYFAAPYQIVLSENLASPTADAVVLRYKNGRFASVGKVEQKGVGNFINEHLKREN